LVFIGENNQIFAIKSRPGMTLEDQLHFNLIDHFNQVVEFCYARYVFLEGYSLKIVKSLPWMKIGLYNKTLDGSESGNNLSFSLSGVTSVPIIQGQFILFFTRLFQI